MYGPREVSLSFFLSLSLSLSLSLTHSLFHFAALLTCASYRTKAAEDASVVSAYVQRLMQAVGKVICPGHVSHDMYYFLVLAFYKPW